MTSTPAAQPAQAARGGMDAETVRRRWPEVLQTLRGLRMATWVLVSQNAQVGELTADRLALAFTTPQLATTFRQGSHAEHVQRALHETLGLQVRVEPTLGAAAASDVPPTPPEASDSEERSGRPAEQPADQPAPTADRGPRAAAGAAPVPGVISAQDAEASWGAPATPRAAGPSQPQRTGPAAPAEHGSPAQRGGRPGAVEATVPRAPSAPTPAGRGDDIPDAPEPPPSDEEPDPGPPWDTPATRPSQVARPSRRPGQGRATPAPPARSGVEDGEDADPDDPDLVSSGLVGAPLVAQMLGGTVIDEIPED